MNEFRYSFSVIIPHRNSIQYLAKLFASIPNRDDIEVILVDNSPKKINKNEIGINREYQLRYSDPSRGAGGARNVGIENASGKWLLFADADDFYSTNAFDVFFSKVNSDADVVYTGMGGIYLDTGEISDRGDVYAKLVKQYLAKEIPETDIRFKFSSPCCKMVKHDMVKVYSLRYDEVVASNDMYFSMLCGYYAKKIEAVDEITYIATVSRGSLTKRRDYAVISSRYHVNLRYNLFLRKHGFPQYQRSILNYALSLCKMGLNPALEALWGIIQYCQNPFVGYKNWMKTAKKQKEQDVKDQKYITK